jgi:hypothetical protein
MTKTRNKFAIWNFGHCDLELLFLLLPGHGLTIFKNEKGVEGAVHP